MLENIVCKKFLFSWIFKYVYLIENICKTALSFIQECIENFGLRSGVPPPPSTNHVSVESIFWSFLGLSAFILVVPRFSVLRM